MDRLSPTPHWCWTPAGPGRWACTDATLNIDGVRTGDLGGSASTTAFTKALVARIANG